MSDYEYDVVVIGGGVSGICAGIASSRQGLQTLLLEESDTLGGIVTAGFHRYLCGVYANNPSAPFTLMNEGISSEIINLLDHFLPGNNKTSIGRVEVHSFDTRHMELVLDQLAGAQDNLDIILSAPLKNIDCKSTTINNITYIFNGKETTTSSRAVIDCSGNGIAIQLCKASAKESKTAEHQLAGYASFIDNINFIDDQLPIKVPYQIRKAVDSGRLEDSLLVTTFTPSMKPGSGICMINIPREDHEDMDIQALAESIRVHRFLSETIEEFSESRIIDHSPYLLDRDGLTLDGKEKLKLKSVLKAQKSNDAAAKCAWPAEFWHKDSGPTYQYLQAGDYYEIPKGCLKSKHIKNLYAAGRCISADLRALASCRVTGTCMATGEAAAKIVYDDLRNTK